MRLLLLILCVIPYPALLGQSDTLQIGSALLGLEFQTDELDSIRESVMGNVRNFDKIRSVNLKNAIPPALYFNPLPFGFSPPQVQEEISWSIPDDVSRPTHNEDLSFMPVHKLASLIKNRKITAVELTEHFISRLKKHGDTLQCVVTITEELALAQAKQADEKLAAGEYLGPLHGIPYGAKDLFAVPDYPTTWGAKPYQNQMLEETSTIITKLEAAGAVLVAKLTLGALAMGDVWFDGITKNPWNLTQGSSGSSAGSASATAAGLVPFAIGTETRGSIISPSARCGTTGLRPTFGRVSRHGAMALSWSMDKIGPICRNARDCAIVFNTIRGIDQKDYTVIESSFNYRANQSTDDLKVGYFENLFDLSNEPNDRRTLEILRGLGISVEAVAWSIEVPVKDIGLILKVEAAAAFDELTRSGKDDLLVRQDRNAWPHIFRAARFIPAVEYIQANRIRTQLVQELHQLMQTYDVIVCPSFGGNQLAATNLTGHPALVLPNGFRDDGTPTSITLLGNLFDEEKVIQLAEAFQVATDFEDRHPRGF